ncbi:PAN domain-containing protein [Sinorhizobium medicae]|uniref:PAN domain-containing protein n=1 Tax=Sinorhizobium medicae TaxID=110321 RepID=UPI001F3C899F|nr:PAN domain-containing protein [Sinorhizobium medicae]
MFFEYERTWEYQVLPSFPFGLSRILAFCLAISLLSNVAFAATKKFGPFSFEESDPSVITLTGEIDLYSALNFRRALHASQKARLLVLDSVGGAVQMALLIADDVHERGLSTFIPKGKGCYSACAFIFMAGAERQVDGELGVHQISSETNDLVSAQLSISDIIDMLARFDTPAEVMTTMFKTPPSQMHVFSSEEIDRYKLNRKAALTASNGPIPTMATVTLEGAPSSTTNSTGAPASDPNSEKVASSSPSLIDPAQSEKMSAIEEFARKPTRIAIYTGLDLFGDDLTSKRTADVAECATSCLEMNGSCKAFTFNANPKIVRGPNCFLKANEGRADGNSVAISGKFLASADPDPTSFSMGTIDPKKALFEDVDLPGADLGVRASISNATPLQCRLACIDNDRCVAFTYIKKKRECWLKGAVGTPLFKSGMISGVKSFQTFAPAKVIGLD